MNKNKNITDEFELGVDWEYDNDGGHIPLTDKAKNFDKFVFEESDEPELTDDQYFLKANKNIYIQVSDKYIVNKWVEKEEASYHIGEFDTLNEAMIKAIKENDDDTNTSN